MISQKSFLVKISVLLLLLLLGKGLKDQNPQEEFTADLTQFQEAKNPLVLTGSRAVSIFPSAGITSEIN